VIKDATNPVLTQADFLPKVTAAATGTTASTNTIDIDDSTGFVVGAKVRLTGGGAGGNAMTAKITALALTTLTLDTSISTDLSAGDTVLQEWGSYMGEPFSAQFSLVAQDSNNNQTQNYQGAYAKLNPAAGGNPLAFAAVDGATNLTSRLDTSTAASGSFDSNGASIVAPLKISRGVSADGPYTAVRIGIAPLDSEGVAMGGASVYDLSVGGSVNHTSIMDPAVQASTELRYGRTKISNAYGSELLALLVPIAIQYWNGTGYVNATDDAATGLSAANISLSASLGSLSAATGASATGTCQPTPLPSTLTLTNATGALCLGRPGVAGSIVLSTNAPSYLPSLNSIAKFGVYKSPLIYRRENY
jgi:MSHA biogenesis protein MshQ